MDYSTGKRTMQCGFAKSDGMDGTKAYFFSSSALQAQLHCQSFSAVGAQLAA